MPDPQPAIRRLKQTGDPAVVQGRRALRIVNPEPHSVKMGQPAVGGHPQVAVARLEHGRQLVLRQAVFHLPHPGEIIGRIRGLRRRGQDRLPGRKPGRTTKARQRRKIMRVLRTGTLWVNSPPESSRQRPDGATVRRPRRHEPPPSAEWTRGEGGRAASIHHQRPHRQAFSLSRPARNLVQSGSRPPGCARPAFASAPRRRRRCRRWPAGHPPASTRAPGFRASTCMATVAVPYSRSYCCSMV